jgi:hypothetical protein
MGADEENVWPMLDVLRTTALRTVPVEWPEGAFA